MIYSFPETTWIKVYIFVDVQGLRPCWRCVVVLFTNIYWPDINISLNCTIGCNFYPGFYDQGS